MAVHDLSQKDPVSCKPIFVQKMIQPTPERLFALFLLYNLSVIHIRVPPFIPAAIQVVFVLVCCVGSIVYALPHQISAPFGYEIPEQCRV